MKEMFALDRNSLQMEAFSEIDYLNFKQLYR